MTGAPTREELVRAQRERDRRFGLVRPAKNVLIEPTADDMPLWEPPARSPGPLTIAAVKAATADFYGLTADDLEGRGRMPLVVRVRNVAIGLARELCGKTYGQIGIAFGRRTPNGTLFIVRRQREALALDPDLRREWSAIREGLAGEDSPGRRQPLCRKIPVEAVIAAVAARYGLAPERLRERSREGKVDRARGVAMTLAWDPGRATQAEIGRAFGRHYATVAGVIRNVAERAERDRGLALVLKTMRRELVGR